MHLLHVVIYKHHDMGRSSVTPVNEQNNGSIATLLSFRPTHYVGIPYVDRPG